MFSDELIKHIQEVKHLTPIDMRRFEVVTDNLKFVYDACVASEQLLIDAALALACFDQDDFTDRLLAYYRSHLDEEKGEISMLKEDLESAGVVLGIPDLTAMEMIGVQYYLIKHQHPASLLGYMAVTEADPTPVSVVEELEKAYGENPFRSLRMHAIKDMEHRKELIEVIDLAPVSMQGFISTSAELVLGYMKEASLNYGRTK